ncbi:Tripeptidyl-peptidase II [Bertholletia excelsa]
MSFHQKSHCIVNKVYVVYLGGHIGERTASEVEDAHLSLLSFVKGSREEAKASLIYSYKNVINGFSAFLTPDDADKLSKMEGVVSVFESHPEKHKLHTTRSWDFVNSLEGGERAGNPFRKLQLQAGHGQDIIVGMVDTGVWPESQSFSDEGMQPIPPSWKGICQTGVAFNQTNCNRKIIGARYYLKSFEARYGHLNNQEDYRSPRDKNGHGTHTASTVGGRVVPGTSALGGFASGNATGGAPLVRLAIYKVCWPIPGQANRKYNCLDDDMLAAIDDAIADGVQVLSISIGANGGIPYKEDGIALGALHAIKRNIIVVCSAGNKGPTPLTVTNVAPWIMTVGASTIDRVFPSPLILGNNISLQGQTVTPFGRGKMHQIILAQNAEVPGTPSSISGSCLPGTLSPQLVNGKIVLCFGLVSESGFEVRRAGGAGLIKIAGLLDSGSTILLQTEILPTTALARDGSIAISNYTINNNNPMATLFPGRTILPSQPAPIMAFFTSVGPNGLDPNILKPDITAPGNNILAAWTEADSPTQHKEDPRSVKYNFLSGTSMACPHVAAAAALLKAIHPSWSSAAIRSALMTTAGQRNNMDKLIMDAFGKLATPFHYGSGHFRPAKAADPGLVYDATYEDYLLFLCASGYAVDPSFTCPKNPPSQSNLNYPSLAISNVRNATTVKRTVTNVGPSKSVYRVMVEAPTGFSVKISPEILSFTSTGETKEFFIIMKVGGVRPPTGQYAFGSYTWSDGIHVVRSPIAVSPA